MDIFYYKHLIFCNINEMILYKSYSFIMIQLLCFDVLASGSSVPELVFTLRQLLSPFPLTTLAL